MRPGRAPVTMTWSVTCVPFTQTPATVRSRQMWVVSRHSYDTQTPNRIPWPKPTTVEQQRPMGKPYDSTNN